MSTHRRAVPAPVLVEHEVRVAGLDARHDGVRVAHLSDVHVGVMTSARLVRRAIELANATEPDLIALTGDYVCYTRSTVPRMGELMQGLRAPHVFATLGNHDYWTHGRGVADVLTANGYRVLKNANTTIDVRGAPLHVVGIDDPVTGRHDVERSFADLPAGGTRVVLCHDPELADQIAPRDVHLILSGHTHGGQLNVKGVTNRLAQWMGYRYLSGFYEVGGAMLYVTSGIGSATVPWRGGAGTRAEVALFTLRAA